jgi:hypothetical protein
MCQLNYLPEIECAIASENGDSRVQVDVADVKGDIQHVEVAREFLTGEGDKSYLPVEVLVYDYAQGRALVDLPGTAEPGQSRVWVPLSGLRPAAVPT